jgi:DNA ligase-1
MVYTVETMPPKKRKIDGPVKEISKPLLAGTIEDASKLKFPVYVTPKIDGIRALRIGDDLVSRQFKSIHNATMRKILSELLPQGSDGEILCGSTFQECSSAVMSISKGIDFELPFTFYWFDYVKDDTNKPYLERMEDMRQYIRDHPNVLLHPQAKIIPLYPTKIIDQEALNAFESTVLKENFEGVMVRKPEGPYKMGRSTEKEAILLKLKRFADAEATIVDVEEKMSNTNEKTKNEVGDTKRSQKKEGMVAADTLGSLVVVMKGKDGKECKFSIGTGFNDALRDELWNKRNEIVGKIVKFKYFEMGSKDAPRFPVFLGFRDPDDM